MSRDVQFLPWGSLWISAEQICFSEANQELPLHLYCHYRPGAGVLHSGIVFLAGKDQALMP